MRILLAEHGLVDTCKMTSALVAAGIAVDHADCGIQALVMLRSSRYDAALLASDLPILSGLQVLRLIRDAQDRTPTLLLLGKSTALTCGEALRAGADDVLASVLEHEELVARVRAIDQHCRAQISPMLQVNDLTVDPITQQVTCNDRPIKVTTKEFEILHLMSQWRDNVVSKHALMNHLYGGRNEPEMKVIDVFICRLRKKLQQAGIDDLIGTVRGRGYMMRKGRSEYASCSDPTTSSFVPTPYST